LGEFRQHLSGPEKQLFGAAHQHDLLGRMAAAGQDVEFAVADAENVAGNDAVIGRR
jgi:hypothetical protein